MSLAGDERAKRHKVLAKKYYNDMKKRLKAGKSTAEDLLAETYEHFRDDPLGYVMFNFPWGDAGSGIQQVKLKEPWASRFSEHEYGPDVWACEFLDELGEDIRETGFDGSKAVDVIQYSTVSGHGIGKSALVAWLIKFILDTRPLSKGIVTAMTGEQLKTKTWSELGKWHNLSLSRDRFIFNAGRGAMSLSHKSKEYSGQWRCDAQTCKVENSESFAGLHAAAATPFYIFDEASGIHDKIFEVREGGSTDGEPMVFDFGNGTRNTGRFFENCVGRFASEYRVRSIDSRNVQITNKGDIKRKIEMYGIDDDYVLVRVLGQFPKAGDTQFIATDLVDAAMTREIHEDKYAALIIGVDVARFGEDETVIFPRIGNDARTFDLKRYRGLNNVQVAGKVIEMIEMFRNLGREVDALFVDGGGLGAGVVDILNDRGYSPTDVQGGSKPTNFLTYRNKSDELWGNMRDTLARLAIPELPGEDAMALKAELTQRCYGYTRVGNKICLETKKDMKKRGVSSPNISDALALTCAMPVTSKARRDATSGMKKGGGTCIHEYDPMAE